MRKRRKMSMKSGKWRRKGRGGTGGLGTEM